MLTKSEIKKIFFPSSLAIIGASANRGKLGNSVLRNIITSGYRGKIFPVNPKGEEIEWLKVYKSIKDIPGSIDLAIILVNRDVVLKVASECASKKVSGIVIMSAGFKESGEEGAQLEKELLEICRKHKIRLVGPNCLGFINTAHDLNVSFANNMPIDGNVGLVSQSGAMGVAMLDWALESKIGFSTIISIGNKADINEVDCLEFLGADPKTKVIMMYVESIDDGRKLMATAAAIVKNKPIVILKAGSSAQTQKAVLSHTGALTGSEEAAAAAFRKVGIIKVKTLEDFFDLGLALSQQPLPLSNSLAIITNAGGPAIMAVDAAQGLNLAIPELSRRLQLKLKAKLPSAASVRNPVDILGDALPDRYQYALETVLASREINGVVVILTPQAMTEEVPTARLMGDLQKKYHKPVLASFIGGKEVLTGRTMLEVNSIPHYDTPERAVQVMDKMVKYNAIKKQAKFSQFDFQKVKVKKLPPYGYHFQIRTTEAEEILLNYHLPVLRSRLLTDISECQQIKKLPVVMKIASRFIVHKAASGGLMLGIKNIQEAKKAWQKISRRVKRVHKRAEIEGILVQEQVASGKEVIIGMKRDKIFGPIIIFGFGGSVVETFHDVSYGCAPLTSDEARRMIKEIRAAPLLASCDVEPAVKTLVAVSDISLSYPEISELDINPMILYDKGGVIVDVRIMTVV